MSSKRRASSQAGGGPSNSSFPRGSQPEEDAPGDGVYVSGQFKVPHPQNGVSLQTFHGQVVETDLSRKAKIHRVLWEDGDVTWETVKFVRMKCCDRPESPELPVAQAGGGLSCTPQPGPQKKTTTAAM